MNPLLNAIRIMSKKARLKRAAIFRAQFSFDENTKVLDLGSETGSNINMVLQGTPIQPHNVYIADIRGSVVEEGRDKFGFVPVVIDESGQLPFEDGFFDIVYCSSVIEHVTVPKEEVWSLKSGRAFKKQSLQRQEVFAVEIQRLGKQYFVQTPYRHFPIESHTLLPFAAWLPRPVLVPLLKFTNRFWLKQTSPDWHLLNKREMGALFQDAHIVTEKSCFITKSIMAVKVRP